MCSRWARTVSFAFIEFLLEHLLNMRSAIRTAIRAVCLRCMSSLYVFGVRLRRLSSVSILSVYMIKLQISEQNGNGKVLLPQLEMIISF